MKPKLMYIASLPCEPTAGGPIQIYRHFVENNDFNFQTIIEPNGGNFAYLETGLHSIDSILYRIGKTRLFPHLIALNCLMAEWRVSQEILALANSFNPQAIVTVAYGSYSFVAASVAYQMKLPIITFFHDWWPDLTPCQGWSKRWLDRRFRRLYHESSLALCVSETMHQELGKHSKAVILYPIPNPNKSSQTPSLKTVEESSGFQLVYLGTLEGDYGEMAQILVKTLGAQPQDWLHLRLYGPAKDWSREAIEFAQSSGIYGGPRFGAEAHYVLSQANAFLVVMSFSQTQRRRVRTSFPSKILEYAAYGKPIVIWGPEDCSAVRFLKEHQAGAIVTSPNSSALIKCLSTLASDVVWQAKLSKAAHRLSKVLFDPQIIHQQFLESINQILDR